MALSSNLWLSAYPSVSHQNVSQPTPINIAVLLYGQNLIWAANTVLPEIQILALCDLATALYWGVTQNKWECWLKNIVSICLFFERERFKHKLSILPLLSVFVGWLDKVGHAFLKCKSNIELMQYLSVFMTRIKEFVVKLYTLAILYDGNILVLVHNQGFMATTAIIYDFYKLCKIHDHEKIIRYSHLVCDVIFCVSDLIKKNFNNRIPVTDLKLNMCPWNYS